MSMHPGYIRLLTTAAWVAILVLATVAASIGSFEDVTFVYGGL